VLNALKANGFVAVADRIGRAHAELVDAAESAMTTADHHGWINLIADKLMIGGNTLWRAMCSVWSNKCLNRTRGQEYTDRIEAALNGQPFVFKATDTDTTIPSDSTPRKEVAVSPPTGPTMKYQNLFQDADESLPANAHPPPPDRQTRRDGAGDRDGDSDVVAGLSDVVAGHVRGRLDAALRPSLAAHSVAVVAGAMGRQRDRWIVQRCSRLEHRVRNVDR
jgi:hypothetical protein